MTRKLRKRLFTIMDAFSNLKESNIDFSDSLKGGISKHEIDEILKGINDEEDSETKKPKIDDFIPKI